MTISLIRTLLLYVVVIVAVRLMGKRQISELQTTELVVTLLISDIAAIPMQDTGQPLVSGFIPIIILVACEILVSAIMLKSAKFRKLVCGKPLIVINNGKIDQNQMRRLRLSTEDLFEQLRQLDVFSIRDVAYAIMETNGKISILKKSDESKDLPSLELVIVSDGDICDTSVSYCNLSRDWLKEVLKNEKIQLKDVFIMTANKERKYNIIKKEMK